MFLVSLLNRKDDISKLILQYSTLCPKKSYKKSRNVQNCFLVGAVLVIQGLLSLPTAIQDIVCHGLVIFTFGQMALWASGVSQNMGSLAILVLLVSFLAVTYCLFHLFQNIRFAYFRNGSYPIKK